MFEGAGVIIGIVNGIRLLQTDRKAFAYFAVVVLTGLALGFFHLYNLNIETGIGTALLSSGLYQVAKKVGGNP